MSNKNKLSQTESLVINAIREITKNPVNGNAMRHTIMHMVGPEVGNQARVNWGELLASMREKGLITGSLIGGYRLP